MKVLTALAVVLLVSFEARAAVKSLPPSGGWLQYANVEDAGYDPTVLASVRDYADQVRSGAVFAVADGRVIAAWGAVDRKLELHSVRKSLYSALWGIAESRGLVNLDATLAELGVDDIKPLSAEEKSARIIDLLHARSGVYHASAYAPNDQQEGLPARGSHPPNTYWYYNNWDFNVAGALLEKVSGKPLGVLFDEWIAKPIGMEDYRPQDVVAVREPGTSRWPALTIRMSARDLARFGLLWLSDGRWNGRTVIPSKWIARASATESQTGNPGEGYGMMWWTYDPTPADEAKYPNAAKVRLLMARGTGGQVIAIVPAAHLVVVHRGDTDNGRRVAGRDIWKMIDRILGARRKDAPKSEARLTEVRSEPFASQLPPFVWPAAVSVDRAATDALLGDYEFGPNMIGRVFMSDGHLFGHIPRGGEAELFALSPLDYFVHVDPSVKIHFAKDDAGKVSRLVVTMGGKEMAGVKK